MSPGTQSEEELIASVERSVYLQRFWYIRLVDRITGTFTGVTRDACSLIEGGLLGAAPVGAAPVEAAS
jgi:predicted Zn-dependent protease